MLSRKTTSLIVFVLAALAESTARANNVDETKQLPLIDRGPAVAIGDYTVSRYLFDKAYNQFMGPSNRGARPKPPAEEVDRWFRLFLAQQVIKADLVEQKQLDHAEVVETTAQMARYMLTQPHGPLYRELGGVDPLAFRRDRRTLILKESQFSAFPENIQHLWTAVAPAFRRGAPLRNADVEAIRSSILATYYFDGVVKQITALDFVQDFQRGIARMPPRDMNGLSDQIEDIVVAEYDLAEAKKRRLDQTPQFLEDRCNFALNQALALYEKEVLSKQLEPSLAELASYYQANLRRYSSPVEITGALFVFPDLDSARRGMTRTLGVDAPGLMSPPVETTDPLVIQREAPPIFADVTYDFLASIPTERPCGPFPYAGKYAVFLKRTNGEFAPIPIDQIQERVRRDLSREKIETAELEYLSRNLDRVQLILDLSAYKMENPLPRLKEEAKRSSPLGR